MATLTCDICGGLLSMDPSGDFAVCESCGMRHTKERVRAKAQEITGTVKIDDTDAVKEQLSNWEKMANAAFNNRNYSEAYTYYCKILEKDVGNWFATYRKGMCMGWKANLNNMRANEVVGGVIDAQKLLYADEKQTDSSKADASVIMAKEVYSWIFALSNLVEEHRREYGEKLMSAAQEYYIQEQIIASLLSININMITEVTYRNYEKKEEIEDLVDNICLLGDLVCIYLRHTFTIKTGSQWNSFWLKYDDVYETVTPDYEARDADDNLTSAISEFRNNLYTWKSNYEQEVEDQLRIEAEKRISQYWAAHVAEKKQYDTRIIEIDAEIGEFKEKIDQYDSKISEIRKDFPEQLPDERKLIELKQNLSELTNQKTKLGIFAGKQKKQLQEQIDSLQRQIPEMEKSIMHQKETIQNDVFARIDAVENERRPYCERLSELENERESIIEELTKDR